MTEAIENTPRFKKKAREIKEWEYFVTETESGGNKQEGGGERKSGIIFLLWHWYALNIQERFLRLTRWKQSETDRGL